MTDKTDDTGKGPYRPGEPPRRPYATIDLKATEIGRQRPQAAGYEGNRPDAQSAPQSQSAPRGAALGPLARLERLSGAWTALVGGLAAAWAWAVGTVRGHGFLSHLAAGVAGAVLVLAVTSLLGLLAARQGQSVAVELAKRLATVEKALQGTASLPEDAAAKLAAAETRLAKLEDRVQTAHAKLAADTKALEARILAAATERIAKLEAALAALSADGKTTRFADVEKLVGEANEAKSASARLERELALIKSEAGSLRQSLEALKGAVDVRLRDTAKTGDLAPVLAKLAAFERELDAVLKTEGARAAGTRQVLLSLEIANLKRALDRGQSYAKELAAAKTAAGDAIDLTPLERYSHTGVPTLGTLMQEFKRVADAAADAEHERPDASVLDRLMAGARSIVRVRKTRYEATDTSVEATLARMESALKEGNFGEVLEQGKRLPPKAAPAAEDWLRRLEARTAADRAMADIEARLKASLAGGRGPPPGAKQ